jgi:hypothetical protein
VSASWYLSDDEKWRPRTWRHFRYTVMRRLRDHGAQSIDELVAAPIKVLFFELNRSELLAIIDSARRLGLIRRADAGVLDGPISCRARWVVTDEGRRRIRHGLPWVFDKLGGVLKLGGILSAIGAVGISAAVVQWFKTRDSTEVAALVECAFFLLMTICAAGLLLRSHGAGANARRTTSRDWQRWQRERAEWNKIALRPFPRWWCAMLVVTSLACVGALSYVHLEGPVWLESLIVSLLWLPAIPVLDWFKRWSEIETDADSGPWSKAEDGSARTGAPNSATPELTSS